MCALGALFLFVADGQHHPPGEETLLRLKGAYSLVLQGDGLDAPAAVAVAGLIRCGQALPQVLAFLRRKEEPRA